MAWLLLGLALVAAPLGRSRRSCEVGGNAGELSATALGQRASRRSSPAATDQRRPASTAVGLVVAVASVSGACLALLGIRSGIPVAASAGVATSVLLRRLQRRPVRAGPDRALALALDLAAAALRSGRPLADALALAGPAAGSETAAAMLQVAGLSRLGADADQAWSALPRDGPLGELARVAVRSATSGIKLAAAFERLAAEIRAQRSAAAAVRAQRAGVVAMAPLAACFLPSFVCLGVIPVVVGIARTALGGLP
jgi:Flp pilus assembly protein TadB